MFQLDRYTAKKYPPGENESASSLAVTNVNFATVGEDRLREKAV
jgi:hypothetical protein